MSPSSSKTNRAQLNSIHAGFSHKTYNNSKHSTISFALYLDENVFGYTNTTTTTNTNENICTNQETDVNARTTQRKTNNLQELDPHFYATRLIMLLFLHFLCNADPWTGTPYDHAKLHHRNCQLEQGLPTITRGMPSISISQNVLLWFDSFRDLIALIRFVSWFVIRRFVS